MGLDDRLGDLPPAPEPPKLDGQPVPLDAPPQPAPMRQYIECQVAGGMWPDEAVASFDFADGRSAWVPSRDIVLQGPQASMGTTPGLLEVGVLSFGDAAGNDIPPGASIAAATYAVVQYMDVGDHGPKALAVPVSRIRLETSEGVYERLDGLLDKVTWG
jgi:hypothetical protein